MYNKNNLVDDGMLLLETMQANHVCPDQVTYNTIVHTLLCRREIKKALPLLEAMHQIDCSVDHATLSLLLNVSPEMDVFLCGWRSFPWSLKYELLLMFTFLSFTNLNLLKELAFRKWLVFPWSKILYYVWVYCSSCLLCICLTTNDWYDVVIFIFDSHTFFFPTFPFAKVANVLIESGSWGWMRTRGSDPCSFINDKDMHA